MDKRSAKHLYGILNCPSPQVLKLLRGPTSQTALGVALGVSSNTVTDWETGRNAPAPGNLFDLLRHYTVWTGKLNWPGLEILLAAAELKPTDDQTPPPGKET